MYIVWGSRVVRKASGRRGDFCSLCRAFQAIRVVEIQNVDHFYFIPIGGRTRIGYELACESCGLVQAGDVGETPPASHDRDADVEALLAMTNPGARQAWAGRLALEHRIRAGALDLDERAEALGESFELANSILARRMRETQFDAASGLGCLGTLAAVAGTYALASRFIEDTDTVGGATITVAVVLGLCLLILIANDGRRYAKAKILPALARGLRPLRPTPEEIDATLREFKDRGEPIGKCLKTDEIVAALMSPD
jgi:hypothetical protein